MRDQLLGYLLNALEPAERELMEEELARDCALRADLERVDRKLDLLRYARETFDPPAALLERTCESVYVQAVRVQRAETRLAPARGSWSLQDWVLVAGLFFAASALLVPAVNHSRYAARLANCQNNLRELGMSLVGFSEKHREHHFPEVAPRGKLAVAGIYAPTLHEHGLLASPSTLICPGSAQAEHPEGFRIPCFKELAGSEGSQLAQWHRVMGGSYGYNLGYTADGRYHPTTNLGRSHFAIMADAPDPSQAGHRSSNHGGNGQNVLFEDGHVNYLQSCTSDDGHDNIYFNDQGMIAAGLHRDDAVIGASAAHPLVLTVDAESSSGN